MRVTIFGASGKVGQLVTEKLLDAGYEVVAFVHNSSPFPKTSGLVIVQGDIHNLEDVIHAVKGSQIIISTLGSWGTKTKDIVSNGMKNIIEAMSKSHVIRVVSLTGSDAIASSDKPTIVDRVIHSFLKFSPARNILSDGEDHIRVLENSGTQWTVLRSPIMNTRGDAERSIITMQKPKPWETVNRQSVADAIVHLMHDKNFYKQAPFIRRGGT